MDTEGSTQDKGSRNGGEESDLKDIQEMRFIGPNNVVQRAEEERRERGQDIS